MGPHLSRKPMGQWASVSRETQTTHCCRLMIKSAEVFALQHVNAAHADSSQLICEVFLRSLQPIGDVLTFRHRSGTRNNFKTRGHQDRQVVTARRKPKEESCLGGRSIEMFFFERPVIGRAAASENARAVFDASDGKVKAVVSRFCMEGLDTTDASMKTAGALSLAKERKATNKPSICSASIGVSGRGQSPFLLQQAIPREQPSDCPIR